MTHVNAKEAARLLGVSIDTVYAYASRGFIRSEKQNGSKSKRYLLADLQALIERKKIRASPQLAVTNALHWGTPIFDSAITTAVDHSIFYRGHNIEALAEVETFESVAALLWTGELGNQLSIASISTRRPAADPVRALAGAAHNDKRRFDRSHDGLLASASKILSIVSGARTPIHETVAQAVGSKRAADWIRCALIMCADHDLNVSTFTVRCVASADASLYDAVIAGICAIRGRKHGGAIHRIIDIMNTAKTPKQFETDVLRILETGQSVPGFVHPLYPNGDPRARLLIERLSERKRIAPWIEAANRIGKDYFESAPVLDLALVLGAKAYAIPLDVAFDLFLIGRTAGWIAHAMEQYESGQMIRPRSRYVGVAPT